MIGMCSGCGGMDKMLGMTDLCRPCWEDMHGPLYDDDSGRALADYLYSDDYSEAFDDWGAPAGREDAP